MSNESTVEPTWWEKLLKLEPSLVTGVIVSILGLIGAVLGVTIAPETVQNIITVVLGISALLAAVLIRGNVTANAKVIVRDDTPLSDVATIMAGPAVAKPEDMYAVEKAARRSEDGTRKAA